MNRAQVENTIEEIVAVAQKDDSITGIILYGSYNQNDYFEGIDIALAFHEDTPKQMMFSKRIEFSSKFLDFFDFFLLSNYFDYYLWFKQTIKPDLSGNK